MSLILLAGCRDDSTTAPSSPSVSIDSGAISTTTTSVTLTLSATDDIGVTAYYASETSTTPSASATGWTSVTSTTSYSASVSYSLSSSSGTKTVYVWFRDAAGNISASASDSITLTISDSTAPSSSSVSINNGDTSTTSTSVTFNLSATDDVGVTGYCAQELSTTPTSNDSCWTSVQSAASYSATVSFTLSGGSIGDNTKTVYVWFRDTAGNISSSANDSITYSPVSQAINLPKTGQTTIYSTDDDGTLQKGTTWPSPRFTVGTGAEADCITDNLTGLMWVRSPDSTTRTWANALTYANDLSLCGYTDWRLPNVNELESLANAEQSNTASWLNTQGFSNVQAGVYWSSTTNANYTGDAWIVSMDYGYVYYYVKTSRYYVLPVRAGQ